MGSRGGPEVKKWTTQVSGRLGEEAAEIFLVSRGFVVLGRNQRTPVGELDLVCEHQQTVVVVEVKARRSSAYGSGLDGIGPRKAARLRAAAVWWLAARGLMPCAVRFDAVEVTLDESGMPAKVEHFVNVLEG
ncbi:MAG: YraN family protein [Thermoleophilia bacterium]|nr:YraN family protein [Thermoleophilia bacterium]